MARTRTRPRRAGQCLTYDSQADVFGGQYTLVERVAENTWVCTDLPPSEAEIEAIRSARSEYHDPERTLADRWAHWGEPHVVKFISAAKYAEYF